VIELRRYARAPLDVAVEFTPSGKTERVPGRATDISLGGMFIETTAALPHHAQLVVHITMPGQSAPFALPAKVRWTGPKGMGVQFDLIGARETFAITEHTRHHAPHE
jgi:type IV pilus assembly protein PilZ